MSKRVVAALAALIIVFVAALAGVFAFAQQERARDLQQLRAQLSIVANSRAQALEQWLAQQRAVLTGLVSNASLQLYLDVVRMQQADAVAAGAGDDEAAELSYLRNLLNATAQRSGFVSAGGEAPLPANVKPLGLAGLALLTPRGEILVASSGMPPIEGRLADFVAATPPSEAGFLDLQRDAQGQLTLGWLLPVLTEQGEAGASEVAGRLLGVRPVNAAFFAALEQPGETAETAETYLIRRDGNRIAFLSPLADGTAALGKQIALGDEASVDAEALREPGAFHEGFDYSATPVFAVSRPIAGTPWVLVHQVAQQEALAQGERRRALLISVLVTILVAVAATIVLVWRFATSARVEQAAREYRASAQRFEALSRFLDAVSDSQPHPIFASDGQHRLTFANRRTAELTGIPKDELPGRTLLGALGQDRGSTYQALAKQVLEDQRESVATRRFAVGDDEQPQEAVWRSYHYPLPAMAESQAAVLTTIEDLTDLTAERRRRERNTRQLIDTLVGLVDERDPDSAHQSQYVAQVARQVAAEMGLEPGLVEIADQAGRLVNIGKIRIPRAVLTKQGPLTEAEREQVRRALDEGPSLLKHLEFDGPVIATLEQINERWDGGGRPQGLAGDAILPTAQVVALANSFVAQISPRAFREGKSFEAVESELLAEAGQRFDKRVVLSLLNFLNNKGGRAYWAFMAQRP